MGESSILETSHWKATLHPTQTYLGRCYIVCKAERASLSELTLEEWQDFHDVVAIMERAAKVAFGATMFNWTCLMNDSYKNEPPTPQVHWHFRPRYNHSVTLLSHNFTDPNFGHHYDRDIESKEHNVSAELNEAISLAYKSGL